MVTYVTWDVFTPKSPSEGDISHLDRTESLDRNRDKSLFKMGISLDLQILGNFWDNTSIPLHEIYHNAQVVFGYFYNKNRTYCTY